MVVTILDIQWWKKASCLGKVLRSRCDEILVCKSIKQNHKIYPWILYMYIFKLLKGFFNFHREWNELVLISQAWASLTLFNIKNFLFFKSSELNTQRENIFKFVSSKLFMFNIANGFFISVCYWFLLCFWHSWWLERK